MKELSIFQHERVGAAHKASLVFCFLLALLGCKAPLLINNSDELLSDSLPEYLLSVYPELNQELSFDTFNAQTENVRTPRGALCIELAPAFLIERGQNNQDLDNYLMNSRLILNGQEIDISQPIYASSELDVQREIEVDPETGEITEILGANYVGPFYMCWDVNDLKVGTYFATYEYIKPSGLIETFSWQFSIVD